MKTIKEIYDLTVYTEEKIAIPEKPESGIVLLTGTSGSGKSTNMVRRSSYIKKDGTPRLSKGFGKTAESTIRDSKRICYSHEYIYKEAIHGLSQN